MQSMNSFLVLFTLVQVYLAGAATDCRDEEFGRRTCTLQDASPRITRIVNGRVFVGVANALHVFQPDLRSYEVLDLSTDQERVTACGTDFTPSECKNFIRTIHVSPFNSDQVLICGSNAYSPRCNVHQVSNLSNYRNISDRDDVGYSSLSSKESLVTLLTSNGRFFSSTQFSTADFQLPIRGSLAPLNGSTQFSLSTPVNIEWLHQPEFVSVYEHGDYVYFFLTETAIEVTEDTKYSRVIRICKSDNGFGDGTDIFASFQKARITCSVTEGDVPFFYDNLVSTFLYKPADGEAVLYGVFNAPTNGPAGGAICKFSLDSNVENSIIRVFSSNEYQIQNSDSSLPLSSVTGSAVACNSVRPTEEADYVLKKGVISNPGPRPLFTFQSDFLDRMTTETVQYRGAVQEVIYFSTKQGAIKQVVVSNGSQHVHTIYEPGASGQEITELLLHQQPGSTESRSLIATMGNKVVLIPRGNCTSYTSCFSCFDSRDAYCGWDPVSETCKNKLTNPDASTLIQTFSANEVSITTQCGSRPPSPQGTDSPETPCTPKATTVPRSVDVTSNVDNEEDEEDCTTNSGIISPSVTNEGLANSGNGGVSIAAVIGVALGTFVLGVPIGALVCLFFYSKYVNRNRDKKDSAPVSPTEMTVVVTTDSTATKINNQTNSSSSSSLVVATENSHDSSIEKSDLSKPTLKPAPPPRYTPHKPQGVNKPNGGVVAPSQPAPLAPLPLIKVPSEYETPTTKSNGRLSGMTSLPTLRQTTASSDRALTLSRQLQQPPLPEENEDDNAFTDNDTLPPLRDFNHHAGTMHGSLPRMKNRSNGVARKQVPGYKIPRGRTESTTWLRQRSESLSSDISSNTSPLQSPISDV